MSKTDGFDELSNVLKEMSAAASDLEQTTSISLDELFTEEFMNKNTDFRDFETFLASGGFKVETSQDFEAIPDEELDRHVSSSTKFTDWEDMSGFAFEEYAAKRLGF